MDLLNKIISIAQFFNMYSLSDCLEIVLLWYLLYRFFNFLDRSATPSITQWAYAWSFLCIISYYCALHALGLFLLFIGPSIILGLFVLHQERIQKNFIAPRKKIFDKTSHVPIDWIDIVIKECARVSMHDKTIRILIERKDYISHILSSPIILNSSINQPLFAFLLDHVPKNSTSCFILNEEGSIRTLNVPCLLNNSDTDWQLFSTTITTHNDTIAFSCEQGTMLFNITAQGITLSSLSAIDSARILKGILQKTFQKGSDPYEFFTPLSKKSTQIIS